MHCPPVNTTTKSMGISAEQERTKIASFVSYSSEPRRFSEGSFGNGLSNEESILTEASLVFGC